MNKKINLLFLLCLLIIPMAFAQEADIGTITGLIDNITFIVLSIVAAIAILFLIFAGFQYMTAGEDVHAKDAAKAMAKNVIIGLLIILAAPALVTLIMGPTPLI